MCKPTTKKDFPNSDPVQMAMVEIGSAVSCLHMPREPILGPFTGPYRPEGFLVDNELWAKHSEEHMQAARSWLAERDRNV